MKDMTPVWVPKPYPSLLEKLKFILFYRKNSYPHPLELAFLLQNSKNRLYGKTIQDMVEKYALRGYSVQEISQAKGHTRERVRQILNKARRILRKK
jgi:hypothetical protein